MTEYIERGVLMPSREKAIWVYENANIINTKAIRENLKPLLDCIVDAPDSEARKTVHGRWIYLGATPSGSMILKCSVCNRVRKGSSKSNYCRDCGAQMDIK